MIDRRSSGTGSESRRDRRALSTAVTHSLTIAITTVLVGGLLVAGSGLVERQTEETADRGLSTIGERLATELSSMDRLIHATDRSNVTLRTQHSRRVGGRPYTVAIATSSSPCGGPPCLVLNMTDPDVSARVDIRIETPVVASRAPGGNIRLVYDGTAIRIASEGYA